MATIKYWDGSAWQYAVVGKQGPVGATGPTGPAGSASLQRFRFVATGGETSLSGTDANGNTLAYTSGLEEVFLNGAALVRGQDYTATNGTSITGLTALVASDVVEILAWGVFNVSNTISNTLVDAKGDLLVGSAADTVSRLAVGSANQVLTVDSSTATGLKWATPSSGAWVYITETTFTNVASTTVDNCFTSTYDTYMLDFVGTYGATGGSDPRITLRDSGGDLTNGHTSAYFNPQRTAQTMAVTNGGGNVGYFTLGDAISNSADPAWGSAMLQGMGSSRSGQMISGVYAGAGTETMQYFSGTQTNTKTVTGFKFLSSSGNVWGTIRIYGLAKS